MITDCRKYYGESDNKQDIAERKPEKERGRRDYIYIEKWHGLSHLDHEKKHI